MNDKMIREEDEQVNERIQEVEKYLSRYDVSEKIINLSAGRSAIYMLFEKDQVYKIMKMPGFDEFLNNVRRRGMSITTNITDIRIYIREEDLLGDDAFFLDVVKYYNRLFVLYSGHSFGEKRYDDFKKLNCSIVLRNYLYLNKERFKKYKLLLEDIL